MARRPEDILEDQERDKENQLKAKQQAVAAYVARQLQEGSAHAPSLVLPPTDEEARKRQSSLEHQPRDSAPVAQAKILAPRIIARGVDAPGAADVESLVVEWKQAKKPVHDPFLTLTFMKTAYALSVDPEVKDLLNTAPGIEVVKALFEVLREQTNRQFLQFWDADPAEVVEMRGAAWKVFRDGIKELRDDKTKLYLYFDKSLNHDKGYGQTFESTQAYLEISASGGPIAEVPFDQLLASAFNVSSNQNIWDGGQKDSGKVSDQLKRGFKAPAQQDMMWRLLVGFIVKKRSDPPDWAFVQTIWEKRSTLFTQVGTLLPEGQQLDPDVFKNAMEEFGASTD